MSNEMFDTEEELAGEEQQPTAGKKKIGFLPAIVIDILKWAAIVIGAIIFIVGVVVITVNMLNRNNEPSGRAGPIDVDYVDVQRERLSWFSQMGDIRGRTSDVPRRTFIVNAHIGYAPNDEAVAQELIDRQVQIKEEIAIYFSERTADELEGAENRRRAKDELQQQINRMMSSGRDGMAIREVAFDRNEIIEF